LATIPLSTAARCLKRIIPFIGDLYLENGHMGTLRPYIEHGRKMGWKAVLIKGALTGIGRTTAVAFAREGAKITPNNNTLWSSFQT